jgi:hypothetical protein
MKVESMSHKKGILTIALLIAVVLLSGCSFVRIQNVSSGQITVSVSVPDLGAASTRNIPSGGIVDVFSSNGGRYIVTMLPSERYRQTLENLREIITSKLFKERETLSAEEVARLVENLNQIDRLIEELSEPMPSCAGFLPDYETAVVVVSYDDFTGDYILSCSSGSE